MMRIVGLAVPAAALLMLISGQIDQAAAQSSHPCEQLVDCDCENIQAGLLNRGWKPHCRSCQTKLRDACIEVYDYELAYNAARIGGYCSDACGGIVGPNPRPLAPPKSEAKNDGGETWPAPFRPAKLELSCPADEELTFEEDGPLKMSGCVRGGTKEGLWIAENSETGEIVEIYYENGVAIWRKTAKT